jgi:transcriptional regulator GlxA family with amidase domain
MATRRIGFVAFEGMTTLDLVGPLDVFQAANDRLEAEQPYELLLLSVGGRSVTSSSGLHVRPHRPLECAPHLDTIIVPGGSGLRDSDICAPIASWLKSRATTTRRIASTCTGIYALAEAGLLDGRRATTHWRFAAHVAERFPAISVDADAIYLRDGPFYTSAGITAGIDQALALVEEDLGGALALAVARDLVVYLKRSGGQMQFSEPLQFQTRASDRFSDLAAWMIRNLKRDLSVESLAARTNLGARHFGRRFKATFGLPPAEYVETLRLEEARKRLSVPNNTVESVAYSVGFTSADAFRRAFGRKFGLTPGFYKKSFGSRPNSKSVPKLERARGTNR